MSDARNDKIAEILANPKSHVSGGSSEVDILGAIKSVPKLEVGGKKVCDKSGLLYYPVCGFDLLPLFLFKSINTFVYAYDGPLVSPLAMLNELFYACLDENEEDEGNKKYIIDCLRITPPLFELTAETQAVTTGGYESTATFMLDGKPKIMKLYRSKIVDEKSHPAEVKKGKAVDIYYSEFPEDEEQFLKLGIVPHLKEDALLFTGFKPENIEGVEVEAKVEGLLGKNFVSIKQ